MKAHLPPKSVVTSREKGAIREVIAEELQKVEDRRLEIQSEGARRAIILAAFVLWQEFHFGPKRMPEYIKALNKYLDQALTDENWVEEMEHHLRKIGIVFESKERTDQP